jgi:hypothetical protein
VWAEVGEAARVGWAHGFAWVEDDRPETKICAACRDERVCHRVAVDSTYRCGTCAAVILCTVSRQALGACSCGWCDPYGHDVYDDDDGPCEHVDQRWHGDRLSCVDCGEMFGDDDGDDGDGDDDVRPATGWTIDVLGGGGAVPGAGRRVPRTGRGGRCGRGAVAGRPVGR